MVSTMGMHTALHVSFSCLLTLLLGAALGCSPGSEARDAGLDSLEAAFRAANKAETIEPMLALYHTEGSDERTIDLLKAALDFELGLPIKSIRFESLHGAPEESIAFEHDGRHYGPTLEPRRRMRVVYAVEDGFTSLFTIGKTPVGEWRIICAKPKPTGDAPPVTALP